MIIGFRPISGNHHVRMDFLELENKDVPLNMAQVTKRHHFSLISKGQSMNHPQAITMFMCFIKTIPLNAIWVALALPKRYRQQSAF